MQQQSSQKVVLGGANQNSRVFINLIKFCNSLKQPFKICSLSYSVEERFFFERPISKENGFLYTLQSLARLEESRNQINLYQKAASDIKYNIQQGNADAELIILQSRFLHGDEVICQNYKRMKPKQVRSTRAIPVAVNNEQRPVRGNQLSKSLLICAYYENQSVQRLEAFLNEVPDQTQVIFFVNGINELDPTLRDKLKKNIKQCKKISQSLGSYYNSHVIKTSKLRFEILIKKLVGLIPSSETELNQKLSEFSNSLNDADEQFEDKILKFELLLHQYIDVIKRGDDQKAPEIEHIFSELINIIEFVKLLNQVIYKSKKSSNSLDKFLLTVDVADDVRRVTESYFISIKKLSFNKTLQVIYGGILTHFDPDHACVLRSSAVFKKKAFTAQLSQCDDLNNSIDAISWHRNMRVVGRQLAWQQALLYAVNLCQEDQHLINAFKHEPLCCYMKYWIPSNIAEQYCQKLASCEDSLTISNLIGGPNCLLPLIKTDDVCPKFSFQQWGDYQEVYGSNICNQFSMARSAFNAQKYSIQYLWDKISHRDTKLPIPLFQNLLLSMACFHYNLKYYCDLSALLYIIFISSYQLFNLKEVNLWIPAIQIIIPFTSCLLLVVISIFLFIFPASHNDVTAECLRFQISRSENLQRLIIQNQRSSNSSNNARLNENYEIFSDRFQTLEIPATDESIEVLLENDAITYKLVLDRHQRQEVLAGLEQASPIQVQAYFLPQQKSIYVNYSKFNFFGVLLNVSVVGTFIANIVKNYILLEPEKMVGTISILLIILQQLTQTLWNFCAYGWKMGLKQLQLQVCYLLHYIPIRIGCKLYSFFHQDRTQEDNRLDQFYYEKIFEFNFYTILNMLLLLIFILVEINTNYQGYILIGILANYGLEATFTIIQELKTLVCEQKSRKNDKINIKFQEQYPEYLTIAQDLSNLQLQNQEQNNDQSLQIGEFDRNLLQEQEPRQNAERNLTNQQL